MAQQRDTIDGIESAGERILTWIEQNVRLVVGAVVALLAVAGVLGLWSSSRSQSEETAAAALAAVRTDYFIAMGATPGSLDLPDLANPEAAADIRAEYAERFREVAEEHAGTVAGSLAFLEQGDLLLEEEERDAALEAWKQALDGLSGNAELRGLLLGRIAQAHESAGLWREAAESFEAASRVDTYPLRHWATLDAARCFDRAGDRQRALELFQRLEIEAPTLPIPEHLRGRLRELRLAAR